MKKVSLLFLLTILTACSAGDLEVENIDFESATVSSCNSGIETTVFFKLKSNEGLILEIPSGILKNEVSIQPYTSAIPTNSKLIYRLFNENISNSYFCSSIPPSSPAVISEMEATGGTVQITTTAVTNTEGEVTSYTHLIVIIDLVLTNEQGESIVNPILNYGSFSTTPAP